jgi:hypothetical protein
LPDLSADRESLFRGWFNNRAAILLMVIQRLTLSRAKVTGVSAKAITRIVFFLEDVERHYADMRARRGLHHVFQYLKKYFKLYPDVSFKQSERAIELLGEVYKSVGLVLDFHFRKGDVSQGKVFKCEPEENVQDIFHSLRSTAIRC